MCCVCARSCGSGARGGGRECTWVCVCVCVRVRALKRRLRHDTYLLRKPVGCCLTWTRTNIDSTAAVAIQVTAVKSYVHVRSSVRHNHDTYPTKSLRLSIVVREYNAHRYTVAVIPRRQVKPLQGQTVHIAPSLPPVTTLVFSVYFYLYY